MEIVCPGCRKVLRVPEDAIGRHARCWACRTRFVVPDPDAANMDTLTVFAIDPNDRRVAVRVQDPPGGDGLDAESGG